MNGTAVAATTVPPEVSASSKPLAEFFPANTCVYLEIADLPGAAENFKKSAIGKLWSEPEVQAFLKKPLAKFTGILTASDISIIAQSMRLYTAIKPEFGENAAVGIILDPRKPFSNACAVMVVTKIPAEETRPTIFAKLAAMPVKAKAKAFALLAGGKILRVAVGTMPQPELTRLVESDYTGNSLQQNENFKKTVMQLGADVDLAAYFNGVICKQSFGEEARKGLAAEGGGVDKGRRPGEYLAMLPLLDSLGILDIKSLGFSFTADLPGYLARMVINTPALQAGNHPGVFSFFEDKPVSQELLGAIPQEIVSFNASRLKLDRLGELLQTAGRAYGLGPQEVEAMLTLQLLRGGGYDLNRNLIANLGDEAAGICIDPEVVAGLPYLGLNNLAVIARVKNPKLVKDNLNTLARQLSFYLQSSGKGKGGFLMKRGEVVVRGVKIIYGGILAPCFAVMDDFLIIASSPYAARLVIDTITGENPSIRDDQGFKETLARIDAAEASSISFARKLDAYRNAPALGIFSPAAAAAVGMSLLQPRNPKEEALRKACEDKLMLSNLGFTLFCAQNQEYPYSLGEILEILPESLGTPQIYRCGTSFYRYIGGPAATAAADDMVISWCRYSHPPGGYNVLYKDGHVGFLMPRELAAAFKRLDKMCTDEGIEFNHTPPANDGILQRFAPYTPSLLEAYNPLATFGGNPELTGELLSTFELYRLPARRTMEKHLFPAAGMRKIAGEAVVFESYTPFPMLHAGGANALAAAGAYLAGAMLSNLQGGGQEAGLMASKRKLEKLGRGLGEYFARYNRMPAKLGDLWKNGKGIIPDKEAFACPTRPRVGGGPWRSDYILLPVSQLATRDNTIIMVGKPLNFPAQGCCLYLDGRVEVVNARDRDEYARFVTSLILNKNRELIKELAPRCCNGDENIFDYEEEAQQIDVF